MASVTKTIVVPWPKFVWSFFLMFGSVDLHASLVAYWMPCIMSDMFNQDEFALLTRIGTLGIGFILMIWFIICALHWESRCFWADYKERKQDYQFFAEPEWIEAFTSSRVILRRVFVCILSFFFTHNRYETQEFSKLLTHDTTRKKNTIDTTNMGHLDTLHLLRREVEALQ